jgi:hypothetical protein
VLGYWFEEFRTVAGDGAKQLSDTVVHVRPEQAQELSGQFVSWLGWTVQNGVPKPNPQWVATPVFLNESAEPIKEHPSGEVIDVQVAHRANSRTGRIRSIEENGYERSERERIACAPAGMSLDS